MHYFHVIAQKLQDDHSWNLACKWSLVCGWWPCIFVWSWHWRQRLSCGWIITTVMMKKF